MEKRHGDEVVVVLIDAWDGGEIAGRKATLHVETGD